MQWNFSVERNIIDNKRSEKIESSFFFYIKTFAITVALVICKWCLYTYCLLSDVAGLLLNANRFDNK